METVEIVIRIPEEWMEQFKAFKHPSTLETIILQGTILPKGHGRIADIDKVLEEMRATRTYDIPFTLERVKPIIEADKEVDL